MLSKIKTCRFYLFHGFYFIQFWQITISCRITANYYLLSSKSKQINFWHSSCHAEVCHITLLNFIIQCAMIPLQFCNKHNILDKGLNSFAYCKRWLQHNLKHQSKLNFKLMVGQDNSSMETFCSKFARFNPLLPPLRIWPTYFVPLYCSLAC